MDAKKVGIEGVSRYGKAALVTMAFDERFAAVLVGSSGEGGAKLHRRNFGEAVENLTGSGEYHWMAGNFLKYGAAEARFGSMNAGDLPVDAHQLIALCAPRPTFISYGIPERGDANWLDQQGSYMATVAAVRIPLPESLEKVEKSLRKFKQDALVDEFITTMNHAAEHAMPQAASIFADSIRQMTIADARAILSGPEDAATQYFRKTGSTALPCPAHPAGTVFLTGKPTTEPIPSGTRSPSRIPPASDHARILRHP